MKSRFLYKNLISLFFLTLGFLLLGKASAVYALIPGGVHGRVWMRDFDGNRHYLGGVKINREDYWGFAYCPGGGRCWGYNDTVESTSRSDGYYDMDNSHNDPPPVWVCAETSGAQRCPTGPLGNVSDQGGVCLALNWCGFNCGSNPHRWKAYFPSGYTLPGNYSTTIGHWETPGGCGQPGESWGSYGADEYYQSGFLNFDDISGCNFIWVPEAIITPTPTPTKIPTLTPTPTPTRRPTPTPTPTRTPTPRPTRTPTPRPTRTPTPTPTPTMACPDCPGVVSLSDILRGDKRYNKFIQWSNVDDEQGYRIYRCTGVGCTPNTLVTTRGVDVTSYTDNNGGAGFAPGTTLMYEVRPFKANCPVLNCPDYRNDTPALASPTPTPIISPTPTPTPTPIPTPTPTCVCEPWQPAGCGGWTCTSDEMYWVQFCFWSDTNASCGTNHRCLYDEDCVQAWFQTKDGDVHAQGRISDQIPDTAPEPYLSLPGGGDFPGVVTYGGSLGSEPFGAGSVSEKGWLANSKGKISRYAHFERLIVSPQSLSEGTQSISNLNGFYKIEGEGNLNLTIPSDISDPNQKVVILVPGNLTIREGINVGTNSNFLAFIVKKNITIDPKVANLEGAYIADGIISTGLTSEEAFTGGGMFIGRSFNFQRDYRGNTPAEFFLYRPDLWINAPQDFWLFSFTWQELAP